LGEVYLIEERLADGSLLSKLYARADLPNDGTVVRVVKYGLVDPGQGDSGTGYRLLTTIPDPKVALANEPAALYTEL
jgi:hypothetical protein